MAEPTRAALRFRLSATLQPGTQSYRTRLETDPPPLPAQSLFRDPGRSHLGSGNAVRTMETAE